MSTHSAHGKKRAVSSASAAVAGPPTVIFHMRDAAALMVNHLTRERAAMGSLPSVRPIGSLVSEAMSGRNDAALAALEAIRGIGDDLLQRCATTIMVTREIRTSKDVKEEARKVKKPRNTPPVPALVIPKDSGWLNVKEAAKRFPFTEGAIRHMIFEAEATKHGVPSPMESFLSVIVRIPGKRRLFLDEKKFAAWMNRSVVG